MSASTVPEYISTTEAILREIDRQGKYQRTVRELAGISEHRWNTRLRTGRWTPDEVGTLARVLKTSVAWLSGGVR